MQLNGEIDKENEGTNKICKRSSRVYVCVTNKSLCAAKAVSCRLATNDTHNFYSEHRLKSEQRV